MEEFKNFTAAMSAAIAFGFFTILFVLRWTLHYREGLAWDGGPALFNWHPVLQLSGFIFLNGLGIIVFRHPWSWQSSKDTVKYIHAALNVTALFCATLSFMAVFGSHSSYKFHMFSLHSWVGLAAFTLFCLQVAFGIIIHLLPSPESWKAATMPLHVFIGRLLFGTTIAVSLTGITQQLIYGLNDPKYTDSPTEAIFANLMGMFLLAYGVSILWISTRASWKRPSEYTVHGEVQDSSKGDDKKVK